MKTQVNGVPEWDAAAAIDGASVRVPLTKALAGINPSRWPTTLPVAASW